MRTQEQQKLLRVWLVFKLINTYDVWKVCVSSCLSSPLEFMVKTLEMGMPTVR
jgi:hypothetical protein